MAEVHLSIRERMLGTVFAQLRHDAGLTTRDAAAKLGTSPATVSRSENGRRPLSLNEVGAAMTAYHPTDYNRTRVLEMLEDQVGTDWWAAIGPISAHRLVVSLLEQRSRTVEFAPTVLPALLRIPTYTRALQHSHEADQELAHVKSRQQAATDLTRFPYTAILDEAVLRRPVGGSAVMATQLRWLLSLISDHGINIHVVPFRHGAYRPVGAFALYRPTGAPPVVHSHTHFTSGLLDSPAALCTYEAAAAELIGLAYDPHQSADLIKRAATDHDRG